jgi:hypothetical protein
VPGAAEARSDEDKLIQEYAKTLARDPPGGGEVLEDGRLRTLPLRAGEGF